MNQPCSSDRQITSCVRRVNKLLPCTVLLAGKDVEQLTNLKSNLLSLVTDVLVAGSAGEAIDMAGDSVSVALIDLNLGVECALDFLRVTKERSPHVQVIAISENGGTKTAIDATRLGAFWFLEKPFSSCELLCLVERAYNYHRMRADNESLKPASAPVSRGSFIGKSSLMTELLEKANTISQLDSPVLITGETGTGKSTLARFLHQTSKRRDNPFIMLNCSAVPQELIEAELFGYEKGAFTGAMNSRIGCIEQADGGTLFLDEIGDLPLCLQPKLLTFLQDHVIRRIGGSQEKNVDVRIITATNRDLDQLMVKGSFREDLYYRINVLNSVIPPIRSRKEDIRELVGHILTRIAEKRGASPFQISEPALARLEEHDWPGNVRELENVLERATAFARQSIIQPADIDIRPNRNGKTPCGPTSFFCMEGLTLEEIEQKVLTNALKQCSGNKTHVARMLGISAKSVYNKMARYGMQV